MQKGALARHGPTWLLAAGIAASIASYPLLQRELAYDAQARFDARAAGIAHAIELRFAGYLNLLLGTRGLFRASGRVTRGEFREYVASIDLRRYYPAVSSVNFAQHVPAAGRDAFLQAMRNDRTLLQAERTAFRIVPDGDRAEYQVLVYAESIGARSSLGVDVRASRPGRVREFDEMRDSGIPRSSGEIVPGQPGRPLALRAPVYLAGASPQTPEERRQAFVGSVGMGFSLEQLLREAVPAGTYRDVRVRLHRVGVKDWGLPAPISPQNLLIDSATLGDAPSGQGKSLSTTSRLDFGGVVFAIAYEGNPADFATAEERTVPIVVPAIGLLASCLLFGLFRSLAKRNEALESAVAARTRQLSEASGELMTAAERERARVGRELHDDLGQKLTGAGFLASSLVRDLKPGQPALAEQAARIEALLSGAALQTRNLARGLLDGDEIKDLPGALRQLARSASEIYAVDCRYESSAGDIAFSAEAARQLCRIAQEAVRNAAIHGGARTITVTLGSDGGRPSLSVSDDGSGIDERNPPEAMGSGLRIMRDRARVIGLEFFIEGRAEGGSRVAVR